MIESLKGVKTLSTLNIVDCMLKNSFVYDVKERSVTIQENFAKLCIIIWGGNVIHFKEFENLWDQDASGTVEIRTAQ